MYFNKKFMRIIITGLLTGLLSTGVAFAASADTKVELDSVKAELNSYQTIMDNAHQMAEYARSLGESEDSVIISIAKDYWHNANDDYNALYPTYVSLNKQYNDELAAEQKEAEEAQKNHGRFLFEGNISFYCPNSCCNGSNSGITALGTPIVPWHTVAVDPNVIPLGSKLRIEGFDGITFVACDTGSAIKNNKVDVAVSSHSEAMNLGRQYRNVYLLG